MDAFRLIATVVVLIAVAVFILLFEKKRATRIERDLSEMSRQRRKRRSEDES
jgi:Sec-independent protein translocase protein TatA